MADTTHLTIRLPAELGAQVRAAAEGRGESVSRLVRVALARHLDLPADVAKMPPHPGGPGRGHKGPVAVD